MMFLNLLRLDAPLAGPGRTVPATGPYEEVREKLLGFPGIGPWSASFLLIRGLGRTEPVALDKEMGRAVQRVHRRPVDEDAFRRLAEYYGRRQGYWGLPAHWG